MIEIPRDTMALAIDYKGNGQNITAVRYMPEANKIIPQFQLNANPASKDFGHWCQLGLFQMATNAQIFIAAKTKKAKRLWAITKDHKFVEVWVKDDGEVKPEQVVLAPVEVKETKDVSENTSPAS